MKFFMCEMSVKHKGNEEGVIIMVDSSLVLFFFGLFTGVLFGYMKWC